MSLFAKKHSFDLINNPSANNHDPYGLAQERILNKQGLARAKEVISAWPGYTTTPLLNLDGIAKASGVTSICYKDESRRFGLKSFKPLGGAYAVACLLMRLVVEKTGNLDITIQELLSGKYRNICSEVTVTAATDGNHGRSVAWGSRMFGSKCVIFINEAVSVSRENAIAHFGADVRRNPGSFDDAVRVARDTAKQKGWWVVPDTSDGDDIQAPKDVTQGYALMANEAIDQLPYYQPPTHLFLQAGVGGMAAATCAEFWRQFGKSRPITVLAEPIDFACWFESLNQKQPVTVSGDSDSLMGGLSCGEVSRIAWPILKPGAHAAMKIPDEAAADTMRLLAEGTFGDPPIVGGESGVAGLAAFLIAATDPTARKKLSINASSRVVLFGSEGATDTQAYIDIVGHHPDEVAS